MTDLINLARLAVWWQAAHQAWDDLIEAHRRIRTWEQP